MLRVHYHVLNQLFLLFMEPNKANDRRDFKQEDDGTCRVNLCRLPITLIQTRFVNGNNFYHFHHHCAVFTG